MKDRADNSLFFIPRHSTQYLKAKIESTTFLALIPVGIVHNVLLTREQSTTTLCSVHKVLTKCFLGRTWGQGHVDHSRRTILWGR